MPDSRWLLTGALGFLGTHIRRRFCEMEREGDHRIYTFDRKQIDLLKPEHYPYLINRTIDKVIHCAAYCGGIQANQREPGKYFRDNMLMGINVIDACKDYGVKKLCFVSTVCAYPKYCPLPFKPEDFWNGYPEETNAGYGIAKRALLTMLEGYKAQYGLNYVYPVLANLYGPGQDFDPARSHVIPALIRKFIEAKEQDQDSVHVWGSGKATRDFLYVEDAARAIVELTDQDWQGMVNVGSDCEVDIHGLALTISDLVGYEGGITFDNEKPDGQPRRLLKNDRMWAMISLTEGLSRTIDWYKKTRAAQPSQSQIRDRASQEVPGA